MSGIFQTLLSSFSSWISSIAVATYNTPYVSAYPWSSGFGTKYADPSTSVGGVGRDVAFNPAGTAIAIAGDITPFVSAYPWSAGFGTKYADPSTLPAALGLGVAFS